MGNQQLLLIVLAMVITGIAISVAINLFRENAVEASRSAIVDDLLHMAGRAREYYMKPKSFGGGGRSFSGITSIRQLTTSPETENARFFIVSNSDKELVIGGKGKIVVHDDTIEVWVKVNEERNIVEIVH